MPFSPIRVHSRVALICTRVVICWQFRKSPKALACQPFAVVFASSYAFFGSYELTSSRVTHHTGLAGASGALACTWVSLSYAPMCFAPVGGATVGHKQGLNAHLSPPASRSSGARALPRPLSPVLCPPPCTAYMGKVRKAGLGPGHGRGHTRKRGGYRGRGHGRGRGRGGGLSGMGRAARAALAASRGGAAAKAAKRSTIYWDMADDALLANCAVIAITAPALASRLGPTLRRQRRPYTWRGPRWPRTHTRSSSPARCASCCASATTRTAFSARICDPLAAVRGKGSSSRQQRAALAGRGRPKHAHYSAMSHHAAAPAASQQYAIVLRARCSVKAATSIT